ncbi:MAG: hypothetical protein JWM28_2034 [Chitinophagaceae bacterium]|nr:hypothetical protein [Chitinophagaceae bacterium]
MSKEVSKTGPDGSKGNQGGDNGNGQGNRITVTVRYQETTVPVEANIHESIMALLVAAIKATGNESVPKERFQLKLDGQVLDTKLKVEDYPIKNGTVLVLVLIAGGGGNSILIIPAI